MTAPCGIPDWRLFGTQLNVVFCTPSYTRCCNIKKFTLGKHFYRFTLYIDPRMRTGPVSKGVIKLCRIPFEPYPETLRDRIWNNMAYHSLDFTRNHWTYTNKQNCRIRLSLKVLTRCQLKFISPFMGYSPETHLVYNFFQHGPQQYFCQ